LPVQRSLASSIPLEILEMWWNTYLVFACFHQMLIRWRKSRLVCRSLFGLIDWLLATEILLELGSRFCSRVLVPRIIIICITIVCLGQFWGLS
jgi:hypothetical protein